MTSLFAFVSLIWFACANAQLEPLVKVNAPFKIEPTDFFRAHIVQPDFIHGAKDCGGTSRITQFTYPNCKSALPAVTCVGEVGESGTGYVYFVAAQDASKDDVLVRASVITSDGDTKVAELPVADTSLKTGHSYVLHAFVQIEPELLGKLFRGRLEVVRASDKSVQACTEVDYIGYKP